MNEIKQVLTRTACLGAWCAIELFGEQFNQIQFFNQQKVRIDLWFDLTEGKVKAFPIEKLQPWIVRTDLYGVYGQTEELRWNWAAKPDLLIMDNYSELTDQRFSHWLHGDFCGGYSDIYEYQMKEELFHHGLLPHDQILPLYDKLFQYVKDRWNIPIIFIHFPTNFDDREKYIAQGAAITAAMERLTPKYGIQNIHADPSEIEQKDEEIYHMTPRTVTNMVSKIRL